jgi:RNA polymerase sigma-70 factor, ECF subfamily
MQQSALMEWQGWHPVPSRDAIPSSSAIHDLTDEELIHLCAREDERALSELVRRHQASLFRFLYRLTGSREDAEDAAIEVFTRAWRHAPRFRYQAKVSTWLFRIAVNIARDVIARRRSHPETSWPSESALEAMPAGSAEQDALERLAATERGHVLSKALDQLGGVDRLVLVLYYLEDMDYDEIGRIAGLSYTVLKTRLARARKRLRQVLGNTNSEVLL